MKPIPLQSARRLCLQLLFLSLPFFPAPPLQAAAQNKLIAKKFQWKVFQTEHFDVYHYQGAERLLPSATRYLEEAYASVTPSLGISLPERSAFFLYLNHNDFEQNNVVDVGEGTGGVTEAFKDRFLVFNDGSRQWLDHVIRHEFTHVAQFHVLYSGFWKSARLLKSVLYPLWFMEGMAEYYSGDLDDVEKEMVLRDAATSGGLLSLEMLHGFNHVKPHQVTPAYKTGNAALEYIAREYGEDKIGILLESLCERFDVNGALQENLGLGLRELDARLRESLEEKYAEEADGLREPEFYGRALTRPDGLYPVFNSHPAFFPDGRTIAYLSDRQGYTEIFLYDLGLSRALPLEVQKKFPGLLENIHDRGSALSVSGDGRTLLFAGESRQRDYLYRYDLKRDRLQRNAYPLDGVASPQFSPDGGRIVFTGMKDGITDLYLSSADGRGLVRLTDTDADESDARFFPDGRSVVFSREQEAKPGIYRRRLWRKFLDTGREEPLTFLEGRAGQPAVSPSGKDILFSCDADGVFDLYRLSLEDGTVKKLTGVIGGNFNPVHAPDGGVVFASYRRGERHLYLAPEAGFASVAVPGPTRGGERDLARAPEGREGPAVRQDSPKGRPYRFRASTDFFFPVLFYSSSEGAYLSAYWQASEMLGNHQIQSAVTYASAYDFLNYQILYSYLKFRPQLILGFLGDTRENVFLTTRESRREDTQFAAVVYPLSRFDSLRFQLSTTNRRIQFADDQFVTLRIAGRENLATLSFTRDVSQGRYLETTSGYRVILTGEDSNAATGSSLDYRNVFADVHHFWPLRKESTLAFRIFGGASFGRDRQIFRTGGSDLLRGYGHYDSNAAGSDFAVSNLEIRFPLFFDLNYHIWFFFPDFLFKNVYGSVFTDNGVVWNDAGDPGRYRWEDVNNSVGLGLRVQAFVLQTFPIVLRFDWAHRTRDGEDAFYLGLGPHF